MYYAGGERSNEAKRIANGDGEFAGADLRGISNRDCGKICSADAKFREVAASVARDQSRVELPAVPKLNAHLRGTRNVGVSDDDAGRGPDHTGAVAALA